MKPINNIIVKVDKPYNTEITLNNGLVLFLNQALKQVKDTVRYGEVIATPKGLGVRKGDTLFFHHSIVGETITTHETIESPFLVSKKRKLYRVPVSKWPMFYAIVRDGSFQALEGQCFVRKITRKKYNTSLYVPGNETVRKGVGEMVYSNKKLESQGIFSGTKVLFEKDSEYEFDVNGETLYRMFDKWILGYESE